MDIELFRQYSMDWPDIPGSSRPNTELAKQLISAFIQRGPTVYS